MKFIEQVVAKSSSANPFGTVGNPLPYKGLTEGGTVLFFSNVLRLVFLAAGIYAFVNFIIAGYTYMAAGGDAKQLTAAWDRIWQTLLGLILLVGSFALAALIGYVVFNDPGFILSPAIYGPGN